MYNLILIHVDRSGTHVGGEAEVSKVKTIIKKRGLPCRQTGTVAGALTQLGWGLDAACNR